MNSRILYGLSFCILSVIGYSQDTVVEKKEVKIGDYIKFNIQAGVVLYNSFSNVTRKNYIAMTSSDTYKKVSDKQNVTFNIGFNFLFGKSPYVKHVIGLNYLRAKSEFYYETGYIGYYSYSRYKSYVSYLNITSGLCFTLFKKINLNVLASINYVADSKTTHTGTQITFDPRTPPYTQHTSSYENQSTRTLMETSISISPQISYLLPIKSVKTEVYAAYNFSLRHRLPWYQLGIHIYPFKKLR